MLRHDKRTMFAATSKLSDNDEPPRYDWRRAREDPLLWAADAIAWSWSARSHWRPRVASIIRHIEL